MCQLVSTSIDHSRGILLTCSRHGNRLDAADNQWHLSSPTPYDAPLTYSGFLQARHVGNTINGILEQAKIDFETKQSATGGPRKRRRFKVVIHSSPFLRCIQTSIGISSGLSQTSPDSPYDPSDILVASGLSVDNPNQFKSTVLRLDAFLGEWGNPGYYESITHPPASSLMLAAAKAELLRREEYSRYTDSTPAQMVARRQSLRPHAAANRPPCPAPSNQSSKTSDVFDTLTLQESGLDELEEKRGYNSLRPLYAVSGSGPIPFGFVAHARDACTMVDFQWDSVRGPANFGDASEYGEDWIAMHRRVRKSLKQMLNWYATADSPADMVTTPSVSATISDPFEAEAVEEGEVEVETVLILVSHGAACNALIGAISHLPALLDVQIASITLAARKPQVDYSQLHQDAELREPTDRLVHTDDMYVLRVTNSTEHLQGNTYMTPRSACPANSSPWTAGPRGRTSTFGGATMSAMSQVVGTDVFSGTRSISASASAGIFKRRESGTQRTQPRAMAYALSGSNGASSGGSGGSQSPNVTPSVGLWTPSPSTLRRVDDAIDDDDVDVLDSLLSSEDRAQLIRKASDYQEAERKQQLSWASDSGSNVTKRAEVVESQRKVATPSASESSNPIKENPGTLTQQPALWGSRLTEPMKLKTDLGTSTKPEEVKGSQLGEGLGGLWGQPQEPEDAERLRDLSQAKRRWTVNERAELGNARSRR